MKRKTENKKDDAVSLKHKNGDFIEFIDEADRHLFCNGIVAALKDEENKKKIRAKEAKCKSSFTIDVKIPEFSSIGVDPALKFKFRKVKNSDEWDLDIVMNKKESVSVEEYFDVVPKEEVDV